MEGVNDILQLCRLCLVKDQVNVPIFESNSSVGQILLKINSCLPVKVSPDDNLPKNICDDCSYKLDMLYLFRTTSVNSEKQLNDWLKQINDTSLITEVVSVKQEQLDTTDKLDINEGNELSVESQQYLLQQQKLPYEYGNNESTDVKEPPRKKIKPAAIVDTSSSDVPVQNDGETEEDDEDDDDDDDNIDTGMQITKAEPSEQSEFLDSDQPGPSGVGKDAIGGSSQTSATEEQSCSVCDEVFPTKEEFIEHQLNQYGETFNCCKCGSKFKSTTELYSHIKLHKSDLVILSEEIIDGGEQLIDDDNEVVTEVVLNYDDATVVSEDAQELVYILDDDGQCVNEVVIEEEISDKRTNVVDASIVKFDHGYIMTEATTDHSNNGKNQSLQPSTSKVLLINNQNKVRNVTQKRRHVVPDFSSTNYIYVNANEEVDIPHYKCLRCEQLFINKLVFFRHVEKGKCYINNCDVCSASFTKNSDFYYHYIVEHTDRAICNFCFRTFMYEKNVKEHMLRHLDQFRHRCDECNKGFYTVREYRNHYKNRHMGIRHTCNVCSRSFADEYYFRRHIATHETTTVVSQ